MSTDRIPLPTETGVYRAKFRGVDHGAQLQLAEDGTWWPHPFHFSGWRQSEVSGFESLTFLPELKVDVPAPESRNPETVALRKQLAKLLDEYYGARAVAEMLRVKAHPTHPAAVRLKDAVSALEEFYG